jgi:hypothetical protein
MTTTPGKPWLVRLTCCGRADGVYAALTWEEADRFRLSYTAPGHYDDVSGLGGGHRRSAVIEDGYATRVATPSDGLREALTRIERLSDGRADNWSAVLSAIHDEAAAALAATPTDDAVTVISREKPHNHDVNDCHECYALTRYVRTALAATPTDDPPLTGNYDVYGVTRPAAPSDGLRACPHGAPLHACNDLANEPLTPGELQTLRVALAHDDEWPRATAADLLPRLLASVNTARSTDSNELDDVLDLVNRDRFFIEGELCEARADPEGDLIEWNTLEAAVSAVREEKTP